MKHPALTRALASALAVFCLVTLLAAGGSLWKTRADRRDDLRRQEVLRNRIDRAAELEALLSRKESAYHRIASELETKKEPHEKAASEYRGKLATYTATRAGVLMGQEALEKAFDELLAGRRKFREGYAQFEEGKAAFDQIYQAYRSALASVRENRKLYERYLKMLESGEEDELTENLTPGQVLAAVASTRANVSAVKRMIQNSDGALPSDAETAELQKALQQLQQISGVSDTDPQSLANYAIQRTVERADALIAERVAQGATEAEAMAEADALTQAALGMSYSEAKKWLASGGSAGGSSLSTLSGLGNMDPKEMAALLNSVENKEELLRKTVAILDEEEQALAKQEAAMIADPGAMSSAEALLQYLKTVTEAGERIIGLISETMEGGKKQLDAIGAQLEKAKTAIVKGLDLIAYQRNQLKKTEEDLEDQHEELLEEKQLLEREEAKLTLWQRLADEYDGLQKDHRAARAALMSYPEIREAVDAGGALVESAETELAAMTERQEKESIRRAAIAAVMLAASVIAILCVAGAFERPKMENLWFLLLLTALAVAAGQAGSVALGRGLWYSSLALGITALGMLPLTISKKQA